MIAMTFIISNSTHVSNVLDSRLIGDNLDQLL